MGLPDGWIRAGWFAFRASFFGDRFLGGGRFGIVRGARGL
jgi:hypothetical protein